jgi:TPR repeat protein
LIDFINEEKTMKDFEMTALVDDSFEFEAAKQFAEQGNGEAQTDLGVMYDQGRGVAQDEAQADYWYKKAGTGTA